MECSTLSIRLRSSLMSEARFITSFWLFDVLKSEVLVMFLNFPDMFDSAVLFNVVGFL